jgi:biotin carboxylase
MESEQIKKKIAIILGGTSPHIELIDKLKKRGYYCILIDYFENPPAKYLADEHIQLSTLDEMKVLEIAKKRNADIVISTCIDQANVTACFVGEKLGLPIPYSYETALSVTNKIEMKKRMLDGGIPTAKYTSLKENYVFNDSEFQYPLIVKPSDSNSSKGVTRVNDYNELNLAIQDALKFSRNKEIIIEEFKVGIEIGIDCFVKNNEVKVLMTKERRKILGVNESAQQIYGCFWPAELSSNITDKIKIISSKIAKSFGLNNTPLMIQAIVNGNEINVIEFAARIGGGESFRIIELQTGFDFVGAAIDSFLGNEVNTDISKPKWIYADNFIYSKPGVFYKIKGFSELIDSKTVAYADTYKEKNTVIGTNLTSNNRVGVFVVKSKTRYELYEKIEKSLKHIDVLDIDGKSIMRKDIFNKN